MREIEARYALRLYESSDAAHLGLDGWRRAQEEEGSTSFGSTVTLSADAGRRHAPLSYSASSPAYAHGGRHNAPKHQAEEKSNAPGKSNRHRNSTTLTEKSSSVRSVASPCSEASWFSDGAGELHHGGAQVGERQPRFSSLSSSSSSSSSSSCRKFNRQSLPFPKKKTEMPPNESRTTVADTVGLVASAESSVRSVNVSPLPVVTAPDNGGASAQASSTRAPERLPEVAADTTLQPPSNFVNDARSIALRAGVCFEKEEVKDAAVTSASPPREVVSSAVRAFKPQSSDSDVSSSFSSAKPSAPLPLTKSHPSAVPSPPFTKAAAVPVKQPAKRTRHDTRSTSPRPETTAATERFFNFHTSTAASRGTRTRAEDTFSSTTGIDVDLFTCSSNVTRRSDVSDLWTLDKEESEDQEEEEGGNAVPAEPLRDEDPASSLPHQPSARSQSSPATRVSSGASSSTSSGEFTVQHSSREVPKTDDQQVDAALSDGGDSATDAVHRRGTRAEVRPFLSGDSVSTPNSATTPLQQPDAASRAQAELSQPSINASGTSEIEPRPPMLSRESAASALWTRVQSEADVDFYADGDDDEPQPSAAAPRPSLPSSPRSMQRQSLDEATSRASAVKVTPLREDDLAARLGDEQLGVSTGAPHMHHEEKEEGERPSRRSSQTSAGSSFYFSLPATSVPRALSNEELAVLLARETQKLPRSRGSIQGKAQRRDRSSEKHVWVANVDATPHIHESLFTDEPPPYPRAPPTPFPIQREEDEEAWPSSSAENINADEATEQQQQQQQQPHGVSWTVPLDWADGVAGGDDVASPRPHHTPATGEAARRATTSASSQASAPRSPPPPSPRHRHRVRQRRRQLPPHLQPNRPRARALTRGLRPVFYSSASSEYSNSSSGPSEHGTQHAGDRPLGLNSVEASSLRSQRPRPAGPWYAAPARRVKKQHMPSGAPFKAKSARSRRQQKQRKQLHTWHLSNSDLEEDRETDIEPLTAQVHADAEVSPVLPTSMRTASETVISAARQRMSASEHAGDDSKSGSSSHVAPAGLATTPSPAKAAASKLLSATTAVSRSPQRRRRSPPPGPTYTELYERRQSYAAARAAAARRQPSQRRLPSSAESHSSSSHIDGRTGGIVAASVEIAAAEPSATRAGAAPTASASPSSTSAADVPRQDAVVWRLTRAPLPRAAAAARAGVEVVVTSEKERQQRRHHSSEVAHTRHEEAAASTQPAEGAPAPQQPVPSSSSTPARPVEKKSGRSPLWLAGSPATSDSSFTSGSSAQWHSQTETALRRDTPPHEQAVAVAGGDASDEARGNVREVRQRVSSGVQTVPLPPSASTPTKNDNTTTPSALHGSPPQHHETAAARTPSLSLQDETDEAQMFARRESTAATADMMPEELSAPEAVLLLSQPQPAPPAAARVDGDATEEDDDDRQRRHKLVEGYLATSDISEWTTGLTSPALYGRATTATTVDDVSTRSTSLSTVHVIRRKEAAKTQQPEVTTAATAQVEEEMVDKEEGPHHAEQKSEGEAEAVRNDEQNFPVKFSPVEHTGSAVEEKQEGEEGTLSEARQHTPRSPTPFASTVAPSSPALLRVASGENDVASPYTDKDVAHGAAQEDPSEGAQEGHVEEGRQGKVVARTDVPRMLGTGPLAPPMLHRNVVAQAPSSHAQSESSAWTSVQGGSSVPPLISPLLLSPPLPPTPEPNETALTADTVEASAVIRATCDEGQESSRALPAAAAAPAAATIRTIEESVDAVHDEAVQPRLFSHTLSFPSAHLTSTDVSLHESVVQHPRTPNSTAVFVAGTSAGTPSQSRQPRLSSPARSTSAQDHISDGSPTATTIATPQLPERIPVQQSGVAVMAVAPPSASDEAQRRAQLEGRLVELEARLRQQEEEEDEGGEAEEEEDVSVADYFETDDVAFGTSDMVGVRPGGRLPRPRVRAAGRGSLSNSSGSVVARARPRGGRGGHLAAAPSARRSAIQWSVHAADAQSGQPTVGTIRNRSSHAAMGITGAVREGRAARQTTRGNGSPATSPAAPASSAQHHVASTSSIRPRASPAMAAASGDVVPQSTTGEGNAYSLREHRGYGFAEGGGVGSPTGPNYRRATTSFLVSADWRYQRMYVDTMFFPEARRGAEAQPAAESTEQQQQQQQHQEEEEEEEEGRSGADVFACRSFHLP